MDNEWIIGIKNEENENITLVQFSFFCEKIEKFLKEIITKFIIYPHEIAVLFQHTHISVFRSLYFLYEARHKFLESNKGQEVTFKNYSDFMINYMYKKGHTVKTLRNNDNSVVFIHI
jgi:hypothetical protein